MKLTIIPVDKAIYKDGLCYSNLDLSSCGIPNNIHALQFNDAVNFGWIEFVENDFGAKENNQEITILPEWATVAFSKWEEAKAAEEAAKVQVQSETISE